ncbi:MAG: aconitase/3-isopropylmalate dehydratase large subunit family protein [Bacteroidia bacterium]|nr:aconitase/3-isopropylmalate dehydratase large subunit family protein [Bacteroidia bacterium]
MTLIEKILANHSKYQLVKPGEIVDVFMDIRAARDFGGANVVKHLVDNNLDIDDPTRTFFTFDCNPTGSDQKYAVNQHICRQFARENGIKVYDIDKGIGTHILISEGLAYSGTTVVTTDSHANILGSVGAFGQGMGDQDIAAAFHNGKLWFKIPPSVKITLLGKRPANLTAKDIVLNLLGIYGANSLLGYSVELYGDETDKLTLDERVTIASMGTEMGVINLLFTPNKELMEYSEKKAGRKLELIKADPDAVYEKIFEHDISSFVPMVSMPGKPHGTVAVDKVKRIKIDSAFIGSCTNGRMEDMREAASVLKGKIIAPGVVLKIVPSTDEIWQQCLVEGLITVFKDAGAMLSNAGCAGCAAGQVGQNGMGEVTISTGNRNFPGKQGKGDVYLASPGTVAASAIAGYITTMDDIPVKPAVFASGSVKKQMVITSEKHTEKIKKSTKVTGRAWVIKEDNIDTDMIFHNRYLAITDIKEMGQYTFDNLKGYEDFARKAKAGDIVVVQKNFGCGSSRQQAVDCFLSLGIQAIIAESFGAIYERNAINAALPIVVYPSPEGLDLKDGDNIQVDFETGMITSLANDKSVQAQKFSDVQMEIYLRGGMF